MAAASLARWNEHGAKAAIPPPPSPPQLPLVLESGRKGGGRESGYGTEREEGRGGKEGRGEAVASLSLNGGCKMSRGGLLPLSLPLAKVSTKLELILPGKI